MATQDSDTHAEHVAMVGPGARLRARRESLGWSVEQVADKLHLDTRYIRALEQDQHAEIAAPVFVRGYLRSYALLLQLPADAIVECYTAVSDDRTIVFAGPGQLKLTAPSTIPRWVTAVAVVITITLIGGIAYFWRASVTIIDSASEQDEMSAPAPAAASVALGPEVEPAMALEPDFDAAFSSGQTPIPESAPPLSVDTGAENSPLTSPAGAERRLVGVPQSMLVLRFSADSWAMVRDATGKQLLYDLVPGGSTRELQAARPPLQIVLGNSPAVTVEYNGKHFDQSRYSRNRVARFTLGGAEVP